MPTAHDLVHEIGKLPVAERVMLVDRLIRDMIHPDEAIDNIWAAEAKLRWNAYKRGDVEAIPYETVMARYRNP